MRRETFNNLVDDHIAKIRKTSQTKGSDYSSDEDALSNFKVNAKRFGQTPIKTWAVYAFKHVDAIASYVCDGQVESEPIESRVQDLILYLFLLLGLIEDKDEENKPEGKNRAIQYEPNSHKFFFDDGSYITEEQLRAAMNYAEELQNASPPIVSRNKTNSKEQELMERIMFNHGGMELGDPNNIRFSTGKGFRFELTNLGWVDITNDE